MSRYTVTCCMCHRPMQIGKRTETLSRPDAETLVCDPCAGIDTPGSIKRRIKEARALSDTPCKDCGVWLKWDDVERGFTTCASCAADRRALR